MGCDNADQKASSKCEVISTLRSLTMLNTELKTLMKVLGKWLARVVGRLVSEADTCATPARTIYGNHHLIRYSLERVVNRMRKLSTGAFRPV